MYPNITNENVLIFYLYGGRVLFVNGLPSGKIPSNTFIWDNSVLSFDGSKGESDLVEYSQSDLILTFAESTVRRRTSPTSVFIKRFHPNLRRIKGWKTL